MRKSFRSWVRTEVLPSKTKGKSVGRNVLFGCGKGALTGCEVITVVRAESESLR